MSAFVPARKCLLVLMLAVSLQGQAAFLEPCAGDLKCQNNYTEAEFWDILEIGNIYVLVPSDRPKGEHVSFRVLVQTPTGTLRLADASDDALLAGYTLSWGAQVRPMRNGIVSFTAPGVHSEICIADSSGNKIDPDGLGCSFVGPLRAPTSMAHLGSSFVVPSILYDGQNLMVEGPFDGNLSNTTVLVGDKPAVVLAESAWAALALSPRGLLGPVSVEVRDGGFSSTDTARIVRASFDAVSPRRGRGNQVVSDRNLLTIPARSRVEVVLHVEGLGGSVDPFLIRLDSHGPLLPRGSAIKKLRRGGYEIKPDKIVSGTFQKVVDVQNSSTKDLKVALDQSEVRDWRRQWDAIVVEVQYGRNPRKTGKVVAAAVEDWATYNPTTIASDARNLIVAEFQNPSNEKTLRETWSSAGTWRENTSFEGFLGLLTKTYLYWLRDRGEKLSFAKPVALQKRFLFLPPGSRSDSIGANGVLGSLFKFLKTGLLRALEDESFVQIVSYPPSLVLVAPWNLNDRTNIARLVPRGEFTFQVNEPLDRSSATPIHGARAPRRTCACDLKIDATAQRFDIECGFENGTNTSAICKIESVP